MSRLAFFALLALSGSAAAFPLTLTDDAGREVTLKARPARILSLAPSNTEIVFALGAGGRLVGRTDACDHPPAAAKVPSVGNLFPADYERVVAAKPDLALMIDGNVEVRRYLEARGVPVLVIQPKRVQALLDWLPRLGAALEVPERGVALAKRMRGELDAVRGRLPDARPRVFYEVWPEPLRTAGDGTFIADIIRQAGGEPAVRSAQDWPVYSTEKLLAAKPDVVITPHQKTLDALRAGSRPGWGVLPAVVSGRVFRVPNPDAFVRAGPRLIEAVRWLAGVLHPVDR